MNLSLKGSTSASGKKYHVQIAISISMIFQRLCLKFNVFLGRSTDPQLHNQMFGIPSDEASPWGMAINAIIGIYIYMYRYCIVTPKR
jgi:hypothetical protein